MYSDEYEDYTVDIGDIYEEEKMKENSVSLKRKEKREEK